MPTGYTYDVREGKITEFRAFAMRCARGFGALITLRDEDMDAPIPEALKPDPYHDNAAVTAREKLRMLDHVTASEAQDRADREYGESVKAREAAIAERKRHRERYDAMLAKVRAWQPPTPDHLEMKRFMVDQLEESIKFDCRDFTWGEPERVSGPIWLADAKLKALKDVEYHEKHYADEVRRTNERNGWIDALRKSLSGEAQNVTTTTA